MASPESFVEVYKFLVLNLVIHLTQTQTLGSGVANRPIDNQIIHETAESTWVPLRVGDHVPYCALRCGVAKKWPVDFGAAIRGVDGGGVSMPWGRKTDGCLKRLVAEHVCLEGRCIHREVY